MGLTASPMLASARPKTSAPFPQRDQTAGPMQLPHRPSPAHQGGAAVNLSTYPPEPQFSQRLDFEPFAAGFYQPHQGTNTRVKKVSEPSFFVQGRRGMTGSSRPSTSSRPGTGARPGTDRDETVNLTSPSGRGRGIVPGWKFSSRSTAGAKSNALHLGWLVAEGHAHAPKNAPDIGGETENVGGERDISRDQPAQADSVNVLSLDLDQHPARHDPQATSDVSWIGHGIDHSEALSTTLNICQIATPPHSRGQILSPDEGRRNARTRRVWSSDARLRETSHGGPRRLNTSGGVREKHDFGRGTGSSRMTSPLLGQKSMVCFNRKHFYPISFCVASRKRWT